MGAAVAYVLVVTLLAGGPPLFVLPMPDARACAMNMQAMREVLDAKASALCFDMTAQVAHVAGPRGVAPDEGEKAE